MVKKRKISILDEFVNNLEGKTRELVRAYIHVPNTPDCPPEMMRLNIFGAYELEKAMHEVEALRATIGCSYDTLQIELQRRLPYTGK